MRRKNEVRQPSQSSAESRARPLVQASEKLEIIAAGAGASVAD